MNIKPYAKAIVGGVVTGLAAASVALADGKLDAVEIISIVLAFIAGTGFVYAVPNTPASE
jgi:hypothetical protein